MSLGLTTPFSFMRDECVRLMTRNSTHTNPTVFSRGRMYRFNMFSLPIGVVSFSDENSQPSAPVSGEDESHSFRSCCSPDGGLHIGPPSRSSVHPHLVCRPVP